MVIETGDGGVIGDAFRKPLPDGRWSTTTGMPATVYEWCVRPVGWGGRPVGEALRGLHCCCCLCCTGAGPTLTILTALTVITHWLSSMCGPESCSVVWKQEISRLEWIWSVRLAASLVSERAQKLLL